MHGLNKIDAEAKILGVWRVSMLTCVEKIMVLDGNDLRCGEQPTSFHKTKQTKPEGSTR